MAMVYCRNCGTRVHDTIPTCPKCGAPQNIDTTRAKQDEGSLLYWGLEPVRRYTQLTGRARRKEYFSFFFLSGIVQAITSMINPILGMIVAIALLVPSFSVTVRRFHDTDRNGWWMIVPVANLIFLFIDSTQGNNRFGASRKYS